MTTIKPASQLHHGPGSYEFLVTYIMENVNIIACVGKVVVLLRSSFALKRKLFQSTAQAHLTKSDALLPIMMLETLFPGHWSMQ